MCHASSTLSTFLKKVTSEYARPEVPNPRPTAHYRALNLLEPGRRSVSECLRKQGRTHAHSLCSSGRCKCPPRVQIGVACAAHVLACHLCGAIPSPRQSWRGWGTLCQTTLPIISSLPEPNRKMLLRKYENNWKTISAWGNNSLEKAKLSIKYKYNKSFISSSGVQVQLLLFYLQMLGSSIQDFINKLRFKMQSML